MQTVERQRLHRVSLSTFCHLVDAVHRFVDHLDGVAFHSLYSVLPLVTQLLGLENPLFGSGKSPYSVISVLPKIKDPTIVKWDVPLSLQERRELIDEMYDMIAPILLGQEEAYIDLLVGTVYGDTFIPGSEAGEHFRQSEREKLAALAPLVRRLRLEAPGSFAHIAHYDNPEDLRREHKSLKGIPEECFEEWAQHSFPTVVELNFRGFREGLPGVRGWILLVNNTTEQLINSHKLRRAKILQCAHLAEALGAHCVGMAGLVAFFGKGGYFFFEQFPKLGFTTRHASTLSNTFSLSHTTPPKA